MFEDVKSLLQLKFPKVATVSQQILLNDVINFYFRV